LLHYLTPEESGVASGRNPLPSVNDVLRDGRVVREKGRVRLRIIPTVYCSDRYQSIFRFGDTDSKLATRTLKPQEDELNRVLKDTVPGLVSGSTTDPAQQNTLALAIDERFASAVQHRLIVSPDAFHVPVVFHPTLVFLERTIEVLPSGIGLAERIRASSAFLEEFVLKIYLPLLEEKVQELFHKAVTGKSNALGRSCWN
jgi:exocyst complex component 4